MPTDDPFLYQRPRHPGASLIAGIVCWIAGVGLLVAFGSWWALCLDGTFPSCLNGRPSFEVVFQAVLATAGFAAVVVTWLLVRSRDSYAPAAVALATAITLWAGWALFLDAATHGWDDLTLPGLGNKSERLKSPGH